MRVWVLVTAAAVLIGGAILWKRAGSRPAKSNAAAADEDGQPVPAPSGRERHRPLPFTATASPPPTGLPAARYEPDAAAIATQERDQQVEAIRATGPEAGELLKAVEALSGKWETLSA